mgnify:CR=1 FL=1
MYIFEYANAWHGIVNILAYNMLISTVSILSNTPLSKVHIVSRHFYLPLLPLWATSLVELENLSIKETTPDDVSAAL